MSWPDWDAIEAAQQAADAGRTEAVEDSLQGTENAPGRPEPDPEASAAIREVERLTWRHPIAPTHPDGPAPTNPDGTLRQGYWVKILSKNSVRQEWRDGPRPGPLEATRVYVRDTADRIRRRLAEEAEREPWER